MTPPAIDRLLVMSPNWLGDAVMSLPALSDLRRSLPDARLIVAARRAVAGLFAMAPAVDEVLTLEWSGRLTARGSRRRDAGTLREVRADAAVLLPNSFASAWLARQAGIPERWGYATDMRGMLLTRGVRRPAIRVHQAEYYRRLVRELGVESGPLEPDLVVPPHAIERARDLLRARGWDSARPLVVMAPGAAYGGAKRWPPAHFAAVASSLVREHRACVALVGSSADADTTREVWSLVAPEAAAGVVDLAGATSLETLAGVMSLAEVAVSNDSGAMHLAGAAGAHVVALFGPTRERETTPLGRPGRRIEVAINHVWCRPCMLRECPLDHRCMIGLRPEKVLRIVARIPNPESRIPNPESRIPSP